MALSQNGQDHAGSLFTDRKLPDQDKVVLSAIEDTLRDQKSDFTPTAYFAALLSLLNQYVSSAGIVNKDVATGVVRLLDVVVPEVPKAILRSKFSQILQSLAPALTHQQAEAPFIRSSIGCLVSLLVAQDAQAWALPQSQLGPRQALASLLTLALDHRPKVRKRAQQGLITVLQATIPGPTLDHPAAEMCAETALRSFEQLASDAGHVKTSSVKRDGSQHEPKLIHAMQLIKVIAAACKGWPSKNLDSLCEVLFAVAKSSSTFLTMTAFEVFEAIFEGLANDESSSKLPRLLEAVFELKPSVNDSQLAPPWIAIISRAYDVAAQIEPEETFQKLPSVFENISDFLTASAHEVRVSASECLVSFLVNCVPASVVLEPFIYDEKTLEKLAKIINELLMVKYQAAWMEVFVVVGAAFENLLWRAWPILSKALATIGDLRTNESFNGKDKADEVIARAIAAIGPQNVLEILPLNLVNAKPGHQGRAWLLPLLRDNICNTNLAHFRSDFVPLSEKLFERVMKSSGKDKTMETKIYETIIQQIWECLPGYCDRPLDLLSAFDQSFAEMISNLLYQQPEMRLTICKALQNLVVTFTVVAEHEGDDDLILQGRISRADARKALDHLSGFSSNLLAVLFNVYSETSLQKRGSVLHCIEAFLSVTKPQEVSETFEKVALMLDQQLKEAAASEKPAKPKHDNQKAPPPVTYALMDLIVTLSVFLPRETFQSLFTIAVAIISQQQEAQLQKKAYKIIPRLASTDNGRAALGERTTELQQLLLHSAEKTLPPARKDRLQAIVEIVDTLPSSDLHFIPSILPEIIICTKETNEKARESAYDLIIAMGRKMEEGGIVDNSKVTHLSEDSTKTPASVDEYFTMLAAGLAGTTPHMISATVTAISRALFEFRQTLSESIIVDLVSTMDVFLQSPTREVVRSVLGFIKVCVVSLPKTILLPRLQTLIPNLMRWSHEHKAHFRSKVKNIMERMIRHYGFDVVERNCPAEDKKLINNIRKTRERNKRKKKGTDGEVDDDDAEAQSGKSKFANEFDEAIYGSDDSDEGDSDDEVQVRQPAKGGKKSKQQQTFIHEDEDEPLDLLDRKAMGNISTSKPVKARQQPKKHKAKLDHDGKLVVRDEDGDDDEEEAPQPQRKGRRHEDAMDVDDVDMSEPDDDATLEGGINAYIEAIRGRDAPRRGRGGKIKFSNRRAMEGRVDKKRGGRGKL